MLPPCVVRHIERPAAELAAALREYGVSTAHEAYKQRGLMSPEMRPVVPGCRVCGPAITALNHAGDNLMIHAAIEVARPGDVLVVASKSPSTDGAFGELLATLCRARGIAAVILDTGVRDTAEIRDMGFPVWARAVSSAGTSKANPGWVNVPVTCAGATVNPGDLILADDDGVVVIRASDAASVVEESRARVEKEAGLRARFERGELSLDALGLRPILERLGIEYRDTLPG